MVSGWTDAADLPPMPEMASGMSRCSIVVSKQIRWLTKAKVESGAGSYSADGKQLTWTTNFDGNQTIFVYDLATQHAQALPLKAGVNALAGSETAFSRDGKQLLYKYSGPDSPGDLWVYSLVTRHTRRLTNSMVAGLRPEDMVAPTLVHYPSHDGKFQISAFVYMPHNIIKNAQYPALVYVHGGPASQFDNSFNPFVQYIANQGYIVIAPNYRGSTGYGKEFQECRSYRCRWRRFAGCSLCRRVHQAKRVRRSQETDHHGSKLRRLSDHDGSDQAPRRLGCGSSRLFPS